MVQDLPASNNLFRLFEKFSRESLLITLVSITCILSIIAVCGTAVALQRVNDAHARAETWESMYNETERECRLAQAQVNDFRIVLIRAGLDAQHIGETP